MIALAHAATAAPVDTTAAEPMTLDLEAPGSSSPMLAPLLRMHGTWPDSCVPKIQSVRLAGGEIDVVARTATLDCRAGATPYEQRANPALQAGLLHLPPRVYAVRVHLARGTETPHLHRIDLLDATENEPAPAVENGFWWSAALGDDHVPALAGSGISLERQGDQLAAGLFGFDAGGAPTWFFGSARLDQRTARIPLVRLRNGEDLFGEAPAHPVAEIGPELLIEFTGPAQARAWLVRPSATGSADAIDVRPLLLQRTAFAGPEPGRGWSGRWVQVGDGDRDYAPLLELAPSGSEDGDSFRLEDSRAGVTLTCRIAPQPADLPPAICTLFQGGSKVLAVFDRIGIDRLEGRTATGGRTRLVRIAD